jgi:hypothetical protein
LLFLFLPPVPTHIFSFARKNSETNKKKKSSISVYIKIYTVNPSTHPPMQKENVRPLTVILQKRLVKKSERWIVRNISSPFVCKSIWWWLEDQLSKNKTDILLAVKQQM